MLPNDSSAPFFHPAARSDASITLRKTTELEGEIERLLLITESLWEIVKERHGLEDQEIVRRMVMIDMRDGKLDGKVAAKPPGKCPKCARTLFKSRPRCPYCGEPVAGNPFER